MSFKSILIFSLLILVGCHSSKKSIHTTKPKNSNKVDYASKYGIKSKNEQLYREIDQWLGIPYKYAGKDKKGVDCSGLVCILLDKVYSYKIEGSSNTIHKKVNRISNYERREGDLVFFKINSDQITHIGLYLSNNKFIHSTVQKGVIISSLEEDYYKKYYYSSGRINR